jgi:hypothetical protein
VRRVLFSALATVLATVATERRAAIGELHADREVLRLPAPASQHLRRRVFIEAGSARVDAAGQEEFESLVIRYRDRHDDLAVPWSECRHVVPDDDGGEVPAGAGQAGARRADHDGVDFGRVPRRGQLGCGIEADDRLELELPQCGQRLVGGPDGRLSGAARGRRLRNRLQAG